MRYRILDYPYKSVADNAYALFSDESRINDPPL